MVPALVENELIEFKKSLIHGMGGFAKTNLRKGTRLIEYLGEKIDKSESLKRCEADNYYIFTLDDKWDLDGDVSWNPAKYINHSCSPNCEAELDEEEGRIWILALRDIKKGEELSFNYGYDLEDYKEHICRCGASNCLGYIVAEEFFEHLRRKIAV